MNFVGVGVYLGRDGVSHCGEKMAEMLCEAQFATKIVRHIEGRLLNFLVGSALSLEGASTSGWSLVPRIFAPTFPMVELLDK